MTPDDATPEEPVPEDPALEDPVPEDQTPEEPVPQEPVPEEPAPEEDVEDDLVPDEDLPDVDPVRVIEALLVTAGEPLSVERLKKLARIEEGAEVRSLVEILRMDYEQDQRPFTIEEVAGGFRLFTRPEYSPWVASLRKQEKEFRLSPAALETLAIVAYRQPVLRADVEKIRGVDVGGALRTLIDRGMVKVVGRAEEPGQPLLYGTTKRFLHTFGLKNLTDLPRAKELKR